MYTLREIFNDLSFRAGHRYDIQTNPNFRPSLVEAIRLFETSRKEALELVYKSKQLNNARSIDIAADFEEVAACCGHFSSSLEDFAEHSVVYLDILDEVEEAACQRRSWMWMLSWIYRKQPVRTDYSSGMLFALALQTGEHTKQT